MLLRENKLLRKYLSLGWLSCIGDALYYIALMTYAATLENPALGILIITISTTFPTLIEIILGALADGAKEKTLRIIQSGVFRGVIFIIIAVIISQTNSLAGILIVGILNALSDTVGSFSALLKAPFLRLIVKDEQLEQAIGINMGIRESIDVIAGFFGVLLLGFLGIYYLAFFNAIIFFIVSFGFKLLQKNLKEVEANLDPPKMDGMKDLVQHIKKSISALVKIKPLRNFLLIAAAFNGILTTTLAVVLMSLAENPSAHLISFEFSVSIGKGMMFIFGLAGAVLGPMLAKKIGTTLVFSMALLGGTLFMLAIAFNAPWIGIGTLSITVFSATMFSIRISSFLKQSVPPETLGTIGAAINLFLGVLPIPLIIFLNSVAAFSMVGYAVVGIILAIIVFTIMLLMKLDKMDLKAILLQYGAQANS